MNKINRQNHNYKPFSFHAIKVNVTVKNFKLIKQSIPKILILSFITMKCNKRTQEHNYEYPSSSTYS